MRLKLLVAALVPIAVACTPAPVEQAATSGGGESPTVSASPSSSSTPSLTSSSPETSQSPSARATVDPNAKVIYLTFDDGPWIPYTEQILDILDKHDATATFFVVGEMVAQHPDILRDIHQRGHAIGNHTWDHSDLTTLDDSQVSWQMRKTTQAVEKAGAPMGACMRPPYGSTNERVKAVVKRDGYRSYLWDYWAEDWNQPPIPQFLDYLENATEPGSNILLHDGGGDRPNTVEAMRIMIPRWIKQGYTFEALSACTIPHSG